MADFILARKSRNIFSTVLHVAMNLLLGIAAVMSVAVLNTPILGLILVLLSKWRVLAVRMRYWWPNIKANLVDVIVGVSVVILTYFTQPVDWFFVTLMAVIYCVWLVIIKPMSSEKAATAQSLIAVFLGMSAISIATAQMRASSIMPVLLAFLVGYAATRHILSQSEDQDFSITTLASGLVFAEVAWLCDAWSIVYPIGSTYGPIQIPQVAIILTIFTFVYTAARQAMIKYQDDFRFKHILGPVLFGVILTAIIVLGLSDPRLNV